MGTQYETIEDFRARITGEAPMEDWYCPDLPRSVVTFTRWVATGAFDSLGTTPIHFPVGPLCAFGLHPSGGRGTYYMMLGLDEIRVMGDYWQVPGSFDLGTLDVKRISITIRSESSELHIDCEHGFIHYHWGAGVGTSVITGRESLLAILGSVNR